MFRKSPETGNTDGEGTQEIYIWNKIETAWYLFIGKATTTWWPHRNIQYFNRKRTYRFQANSSYCQKLQVDYEVTLWNYTRKDVAQLLDSACSVRESSILGTDYLKTSSKQHQLICSKTVWTSIGKIWVSTSHHLQVQVQVLEIRNTDDGCHYPIYLQCHWSYCNANCLINNCAFYSFSWSNFYYN